MSYGMDTWIVVLLLNYHKLNFDSSDMFTNAGAIWGSIRYEISGESQPSTEGSAVRKKSLQLGKHGSIREHGTDLVVDSS